MTALNKKPRKQRISTRGVQGTSYNGNPQDYKKAEQDLYEIMVMSLYGRDSYYETMNDRVDRLKKAIETVVVGHHNMGFVANAIINARTQMHIRSMPIMATVLFANVLREQGIQYPHLRELVTDVIQRADQITDLYAVALLIFGNKNAVPMAIKRGVADAFNKFDEYHFGKYNNGGEVKLSDVLRIVHPKPINNKKGEVFQRIIEGTLQTPYTWETVLSGNGQLPESERRTNKEVWTELLKSGKLGYMALLRNLRNITECKVDAKTMEQHVYNRLADPVQVRNSKQLPFRFVSALDALDSRRSPKLKQAISRAIDASVSNIPIVGKHVWIIVDCSGSMKNSRAGSKASNPYKTASILGAALAKANSDASNLVVTLFSNEARNVDFNPDDSVLGIVSDMERYNRGYQTNLRTAINTKSSLGFEPDTVILLSDMQVNLMGYTNMDVFDPDCIKVAINMDAYETTPVGETAGWMQLAGWSDRIFDFIPAIRDGSSIADQLSGDYMGLDHK